MHGRSCGEEQAHTTTRSKQPEAAGGVSASYPGTGSRDCMATPHTPLVRRAVGEDAPAILTLVDALADYEKLDRPQADARERLVRDLFGPNPRLDCWLVFFDDHAAGYAFTLETYSSFLALPTLYLEDLFILEEYRGRRAGYALFQHVL